MVSNLRGLVATRSRREKRHKGEDLHHSNQVPARGHEMGSLSLGSGAAASVSRLLTFPWGVGPTRGAHLHNLNAFKLIGKV
jgi:hypothetical protein